LNGKDGEMPPLKCNVMVKIEVVAKPEGWNHRHVGKEGKIKVVRSRRPTHANGLAQSMVGRYSGTLPTRIEILVLAPFSGFISGFSDVMR
jgi:hypothetical protein